MKPIPFASLFTAASVSLSAASHGAIIWFAAQDIPIPTGFAGVVVDLEDGTDTAGDDAVDADVNFFFGGLAISNDADSTATMPSFQPVRLGTGSVDTVANLTLATSVDAGSTFATGFGGSADHIGTEFTAGTPGYIGFSLDHSTLGLVYGWMRVTLNPNTADGTIHEWAFEDTGAPIHVGAVPEPTTSLLALLALAGLALRRRRWQNRIILFSGSVPSGTLFSWGATPPCISARARNYRPLHVRVFLHEQHSLAHREVRARVFDQ